ncbi:MAG: preprotein translocase subunit SecY [Firmicutes bacterium]|nr:preprotein translocase subunit SecY [Bacillota bacterium]
MLQTIVNAFKNKDIRKKILITIGLLFIYRIGCYIPIPGISLDVYDIAHGTGDQDQNTMLMLLSSLSGGALANGALFAIGISPYINSSIIIQLLTVAIPKLEQWSKQGDEGKRKINITTRILTLVLAIAQAIGIVVNWSMNGAIYEIFGVGNLTWLVSMFVALVMVAGAMLTMWIGERITEMGIGNGISLLIFVGILSSAGLAIISLVAAATPDTSSEVVWQIVGFFLLVIAIFAFIVFIDSSERRIPIQYAKQVKGRKQYGGQSTFIPIKINAAGVLPIIFANALISFPQLIMSMIPTVAGTAFYGWWQRWMGVGAPVYCVVVGLLILFFSYFYAQIQFKPDEVARNIQQYGGFIPGIRPGRPTQEYLTKVTRRITFWGALFLAFIAIVPSLIFAIAFGQGSPLLNGFSATGMLIVVSVALEFEKQLQSQLMMKQYKGFLK